MINVSLTRHMADQTMAALREAILKGLPLGKCYIEVAEALNVSRTTIHTRVGRSGPIKRLYPDIWFDAEKLFIETNETSEATTYTPIRQDIPSKPRIIVKTGDFDSVSYRICAIGDTHDSPSLPDKERFSWIARHIAATNPDRVVQIGDFGDFESCSSHETPGSTTYAMKPSFRMDLESLEEALHLIFKEVGSDIPLHVLEGNHEDRVYRYQDLHPETNGIFVEQLQDLWGRYGWRPQKYGEWLFVGGVGFTHVPKTVMGKAYGGKFSENQIGNDAVFSIVYGHSHRAAFRQTPKIGPAQCLEVLNLGSAMPDGYIARYAGTATTGWTYGIYDLEIRAGHIVAHNFIPMSNLKSMYGD
ncbi:calcineurin-like phosphoesterase [Caudoviricetes sp.]|nr:calcineurin-like phosphoesterase [Caudoviricetes sp.]